jgi:GntR family transcriptional regulator
VKAPDSDGRDDQRPWTPIRSGAGVGRHAPNRSRFTSTAQTSPRRIADLIRASIRSERIVPRDKLPEEILIRELDSSRSSVRQALQMLAEQGLLERRQRVGTIVSGTITKVLDDEIFPLLWDSKGAPRTSVRRLDDRVLPGVQLLVEQLEISDGGLRLVEDLVLLDDLPVAVAVSYLEKDANAVASLSGITDVAGTFKTTYGVEMGSVESSVEALPCEPQTARVLKVPEGSPVLVKEMILRDRSDRARGICYIHYRGGSVSLSNGRTLNAQGG